MIETGAPVDHVVVETDEGGVTHRYHTNWRRGELLPFRSTWPEKWQREAREAASGEGNRDHSGTRE
jgi:hypothetical protein